ncbi:hypothetical protein [Anaerostipes sp. Marseille-Q3525]|uniref:hypothetical protein n=1 Tax=Anaerostipes sp. Marseille-Q3525 TaxID=2758418 RepID=UPI001BAC5A68|nr:hypothetical protein [Anaerostipes sp. Marseille-Q3525]MBR9961689.1 hypothetical protein [Anaerostipes sp. Marseille-Q3525]
MGIKNLTEAEEKEFYRLVGKMNGKEPDKKQDVKVNKPQISERYFYISDGVIVESMWANDHLDEARWELGNVFFTEEEAEFAREKKKVEVELARYADEHNDTDYSGNDYYHIIMHTGVKITNVFGYWKGKVAGATYFTSEKVAKDAIEAVGKDRILKYIFGVESEENE